MFRVLLDRPQEGLICLLPVTPPKLLDAAEELINIALQFDNPVSRFGIVGCRPVKNLSKGPTFILCHLRWAI